MAILLLNNVPDTLKDEFKTACACVGHSMTKTVIEFMKQFIKEQNEKKNLTKFLDQ